MTTPQRILIIDDESAIRNILNHSLKVSGYEIMEAASAEDGLKKTSEFHPHLIILDLGLPDLNGFDVLKKIRSWTNIPIIILTVKDDESMKVKLLDAGADDYLTKPFGTSELLARVRVSLRHNLNTEATPLFESGHLKIDLSQKLILVSGEPVKLTNTEFELLSRLVRDNGKVIVQSQLLKQVWGAATEDQSHYLRIYIKQLRKKLEKNPSKPEHILTEPGVGYRLV